MQNLPCADKLDLDPTGIVVVRGHLYFFFFFVKTIILAEARKTGGRKKGKRG
jgi:hypothetical protein